MTKIENLPEKLKRTARFCVWQYEERDGRRTKMPKNPHTGGNAMSNNPDTFGTLADAAAVMQNYDGLGIGVFGTLTGIDIDHCITDGKLSADAADIVAIMDAYTEISPSGTGLRILFDAPGMTYDTAKYYIKNSNSGIEIYVAGMTKRFLTVTGDVLPGCQTRDIVERSDRLRTVIEKYMKRPEQTQTAPQISAAPLTLTDRELIEKAMNAANGSKFSALWSGNWEGQFNSQSEADAALCNSLAFWTQKDADRMDALFRQSGLMRDKWDRRQSGTTYGQITIQKAISQCSNVYEPRQNVQKQPVTGGNGAGDEIPIPQPETPQEPPEKAFDAFLEKIQTDAFKPIETGMPAFDRLLGGGIVRQSLVILSAAPGTGKTSLASQIFEAAAMNGTDVVFLNLEMSREQLFARSLSRICHRQGHRMSAADIMKGYAWTEPQKQFVKDAADEYRRRIEPHLRYNPPGCTTDIDAIINYLNNAAEQAKKDGRRAPVCVLDYLHLVTGKPGQDATELIKGVVAALKDYAIKYDTFIFAISANNRNANSSGRISMDSGRDSSAIEYTADYQISLNYRALHMKKELTFIDENGMQHTNEKANANNPDHMAYLQKGNANGEREMLVQVLKHRTAEPGGTLWLNFNAADNVFIPVDKPKKTVRAYYNPSDERTPFDDDEEENEIARL